MKNIYRETSTNEKRVLIECVCGHPGYIELWFDPEDKYDPMYISVNDSYLPDTRFWFKLKQIWAILRRKEMTYNEALLDNDMVAEFLEEMTLWYIAWKAHNECKKD